MELRSSNPLIRGIKTKKEYFEIKRLASPGLSILAEVREQPQPGRTAPRSSGRFSCMAWKRHVKWCCGPAKLCGFWEQAQDGRAVLTPLEGVLAALGIIPAAPCLHPQPLTLLWVLPMCSHRQHDLDPVTSSGFGDQPLSWSSSPGLSIPALPSERMAMLLELCQLQQLESGRFKVLIA
ncbi:hypothetical protein WISP_42357 [Willisornis vidua]|uniref:Uncharacterized protein n=1 Tax=Willisornis vidua TaxID=1566151 RepID=A0ABQ9DGA3_9PASS|nr:hypothetical protein WISP_42357 [Willisornis vidua]